MLNQTIWNTETLFEGRISNSQALAMAIAIVPTVQKPDHSKSESLSPDFKWFDKMVAKSPDFKWLSFPIPDLIRNLDHLQPNLFSTIQNQDYTLC